MKLSHASIRPRARLTNVVDHWWERLVQLTFCLFVGGLVALLIMLYAGVPIV
jgi:hypothetical protein